MLKLHSILTFAVVIATRSLPAVEAPSEPQVDINQVSEAFGHLIGQNLDSLGFEFEMDQVIKGLQASLAGDESPMTEEQTVQAISIIQEQAYHKLSAKNLEEASHFLGTNKTRVGIVELEQGKVQYRIEKMGEGNFVEPQHAPLLTYTGRFLDGQVFGEAKEPIRISLGESIQGFGKALVGMREGEKRTIYIHPDQGYGTAGTLPPNSLLVFDVEIVKAHQEDEKALPAKANEEAPQAEEPQ